MNIELRRRAPSRLVPEEPFPPYAFVPGKSPHPTRSPKGHSYGKLPAPCPALDPSRWQDCSLYLRGIDLFNHGYYWEAHEAWESLWQAAGRRGVVADLLKGLIALAAAGVKAREGRAAGVRQHAQRAQSIFSGISTQGSIMGLDLAELRGVSEALAASADSAVNTASESVVIALPFKLMFTD